VGGTEKRVERAQRELYLPQERELLLLLLLQPKSKWKLQVQAEVETETETKTKTETETLLKTFAQQLGNNNNVTFIVCS